MGKRSEEGRAREID